MDNFKLSSQNCFARTVLDRATHLRLDDAWISERLEDPATRIVPVWQTKSLVTNDPKPHAVTLGAPRAGDILEKADSLVLLGEDNGRTYFAAGIESEEDASITRLISLGQFKDLRAVGALLEDRDATLLVYSRAITYWHRRHRFCGVCGGPTRSASAGHIRVCTNPGCAQEHFPRTDPAIIVITASGKDCLLGRQPTWPPHMYSTIAGFVEPGESAESAVVREVFEETGVRVHTVRYHSSQPWPFPCSIMLGFIAEATKSVVSIDGRELENARWFSRDEIKVGLKNKTLRLPGPVSIAYRLIEHWFDPESPIPLEKIIRAAGTP